MVIKSCSGSQTVHPAANVQVALTERQNADLHKLARMCSQNKQANMAYLGIGNSRVQQQSLQSLRAVHERASGLPAHHAQTQQAQQPAPSHKWRPRGELSHSSKSHVVSCLLPYLALQPLSRSAAESKTSCFMARPGKFFARLSCSLLSQPLCSVAARASSPGIAVCRSEVQSCCDLTCSICVYEVPALLPDAECHSG